MKCVLIVDDNADARELVAEWLVARYTVMPRFAVCSKDAIAILRAEPIDFVICDFMMPGGTGIEVYDFIESLPEEKQAWFILFTAIPEFFDGEPDGRFNVVDKLKIDEIADFISENKIL